VQEDFVSADVEQAVTVYEKKLASISNARILAKLKEHADPIVYVEL
jgi:hypothetical protein